MFKLAQRALHKVLAHAALTAAVLIGIQIHNAQAELVFESNAPTAVPTSTSDGTGVMTREAVREDRHNLRQVLNTSQKAEATNTATAAQVVNPVQAQPTGYANAPVSGYTASSNGNYATTSTTTMVSPPPSAQAPSQQSLSVLTSVSATEPHTSQTMAPAPEVQNLSKSELMRRERVREELRNEDLLQERLEELRLRDEKRRTDQMVGSAAPLAGAPAVAPVETQMPPVPAMTEERVGAGVLPNGAQNGTQNGLMMAPMPANPQTYQPGMVGSRPVVIAQNSQYGTTNGAGAGMQAQGLQPVMGTSDQLGVGQASTTFVNTNTVAGSEHLNPEEKTAFWISPKFGVSNMSEASGLNVQGRYTAGIGFGVGISENLSFDLGYQFSEYGVGLSGSNPYQAYQPYGSNANNQNRSYKQNVVDAGIKLHFLGTQAKVRPFVGGGGAWSKSFLNYDEAIVKAYNQMGWGNLAQDYEVSSYLGYLSTGLDIKLSKSVSLGATFKYYRVLSSHENQNLSYYGLSSYGVNPNSDNATVGGSLAKENFYSVLAGMSFQF